MTESLIAVALPVRRVVRLVQLLIDDIVRTIPTRATLNVFGAFWVLLFLRSLECDVRMSVGATAVLDEILQFTALLTHAFHHTQLRTGRPRFLYPPLPLVRPTSRLQVRTQPRGRLPQNRPMNVGRTSRPR